MTTAERQVRNEVGRQPPRPADFAGLARNLSPVIAAGAIERDRDGIYPVEPLRVIADAGLLTMALPSEAGEAGAPRSVILDVIRILAGADPAVAQILQPHFSGTDALRNGQGTVAERSIIAEVRKGQRIGSAVSERDTASPGAYLTRIEQADEKSWTVNGRKYYCTGALGAGWLTVLGLRSPRGNETSDQLVKAFVRAGAPGVSIGQDWASFGQRTTVSGTTQFTEVRVPDEFVVSGYRPGTGAARAGSAFGQAIHAAIDVGIAEGALADGVDYVRTRARPWTDAGVAKATAEPQVIQHYGRLETLVTAARALLGDAARSLDMLAPDAEDEAVALARLHVAKAKAFAAEIVLEVTTAIFEATGASGANPDRALDRHWRNARAHTLHDPARWKHFHIGNWLLNDVPPAASNHVI